MQTTYIFGHKKPDTDSICASISLSYLKNKLGLKCEPASLGEINKETKYALNYFNLKAPKYLNDVKLQIKDIEYKKNYYLNKNESINAGFNYMHQNDLTGLPIVDENKKLIGLVTLKELAKDLIQGNFTHLKTSYKNIVESLEGVEVLKFDDEIEGNIMAAAFRSTTFIQSKKINHDDIVIIGDRNNILEYVINSKAKLIIIVGDGELSINNYELAKKNKVNVIKTKFDTFHTSKLISLSNYIENVAFKDPVVINENDYYSTFKELVAKTKHTNYPVINKKGECLGLLPLTLSNLKQPKKVILVDHNEKEQSVDGLEEATIVEVVDHHKLGTLATSMPINFRNMAVGSSNTIIYNLFKENKIVIPQNIAGAMLSGILSDTLLLKSPTTTKLDKEAVLELEEITSVNYQEYGMNMFKAGSSLEGISKEDIIYKDFKKFNYDNLNIGVGQVFTTDVDYILNEKEEYVKILNKISLNENYKIVLLFVTDIINNGSYILYNDESYNIILESYKLERLKQGYYLKDVVSRKKQFIPPILETLEKVN